MISIFLILKIVTASSEEGTHKRMDRLRNREKKERTEERKICSKVSKKISRWEERMCGGGWRVLLRSAGPSNDTAKSVLQSSRWHHHHSYTVVCHIVLHGLVVLSVFLPCARKTEWGGVFLCTWWRYYTIRCVRLACVSVFVSACTRVCAWL